MSTAMDLVNGECGGESLLLGKANTAAPMKKVHAKKCVFGQKGTEDAPIEVIQPEQSSWYQMYVVNFCLFEEDLSEVLKFFRTRFCLPYSSFLELVADISANDIFDRWCDIKNKNHRCSPIQLLVLGPLRYLGQGWTFEDIEESTAITLNVHRVFFITLSSMGAQYYIANMY
jgi:hypothetical protein